MIINKLRIDSFKSFYDSVEIDFNNIKGLWKISGAVGVGKTTIGEAILFGLFGTVTGKNNADLVPWGKKKANVEIWCTSNGHSIYISRDISHSGTSKIYVEVDGEELIFTNKRDAQQQLETEYYDVSKVTMELLCIISFNNFKSLATLNTSDTKKFLDQVLGFYILTQYGDICKEFRQENNKALTLTQNAISRIDAQINKIKELSNIELIEGDMSEVANTIKLLDNSVNEIKAECDKKVNVLISKEKDLREKATKIKTLGASKKKEIDFIEKGVCPTCGGIIDQSQLEIKKQEYQVFIEQYKTLAEQVRLNTEEIKSIETECYDKVSPIKIEINEHKEHLAKLKAQASRLSVNEDEINKLVAEKSNLLVEYESYLSTEDLWNKLYHILTDDVRAKILESFIPALNKNIMNYAQQLHQPYVISFDNQFKCSVSLCGFMENIPISSLSTGQLKTVDMMIILGVLGTIIGTTSTNVIFLDELFSNLDGELRNDMCSVLKNFIKPGNTMFVISHRDLDNKYFDGALKLKLEQQGQYEMHSALSIENYIKEY